MTPPTSDVSSWLFDGWAGPARTAVVGVLAYVALVCLLRVAGKRTLSKMNAFDLVVTVALGSTLASALTSNAVTLVQCATAFLVLVLLQYGVAFSASRSRRFSRVVKASPKLLVARGRVLDDELRRERVAVDELLSALRAHGLSSPSEAAAVVLETDGTFTVLRDVSPTDPDLREIERDDDGASRRRGGSASGQASVRMP